MRKAVTMFSALVLLFLYETGASAQESPEKTCGKALAYYKQLDINKALKEARWCVEALQKIQRAQLEAYFKAEIDGFSGRTLQSSAIGAGVTIERVYVKAHNSIKVTFTGFGGKSPNPFVMLGQMGLIQGGEKIRIQNHTAFISSLKKGDQIRVILMVNLDNGGSLEFRSEQLDSGTLKTFAEAFPIAALDKAIGD